MARLLLLLIAPILSAGAKKIAVDTVSDLRAVLRECGDAPRRLELDGNKRYFLESPLEILAPNGSGCAPVTLSSSDPNAPAIMDGGVPIDGWKAVPGSPWLFSAPAPAGLHQPNCVQHCPSIALIPIFAVLAQTSLVN